MTWFARITDERTKEKRGRERVFLVNEESLRKNPNDRKLERRCAALAIELERPNDARRHLIHLNDAIQADPDKATEAAELEDLLGQCDQPESKFDEAEQHYRKSIALDPTRVVTFDRLARLLRQDVKPPEAADRAIEEMLKANPKSALAHVNRWRYRREFGPAADGGDIALALKLGPDEAEVLIAAAELARQSKDLAGARKHLERGLDRHPEDAGFYQMAADLELADNHADRAEAILRRGIAAVPSNAPLKMLLAETLISENKLDGDEGAIAWIERLRRLGLADGYALFLQGQVAMTQQNWHDAISRLDSARSLLAGDTAIVSRINLLLAECHSRTGETEKRVAALERAASGETNAAMAGPLLAQAMESEGRLDEAIKVHLMLVERRPQSRLDLVRLLIQKYARLPQQERRWKEVEQRLQEAEKAVPKALEDLTRLRADLLAAQNREEEARKVLTAAQLKDPRNLNYSLALARIAQKEAKIPLALQTLDQAEKDLGPSLEIQLARLELWAQRGGDEAKVAVAKLAEARRQVKPAELPDFLDRLAQTELRLREPALARQYWNELVAVQPDNFNALLSLFDLSLQSNDLAGARELVAKIRKVEGDREGTQWRFTEAALDLDEYRRDPKGASQKLQAAGELASMISELRPGWWGGPVLKGQMAELKGLTDEAIEQFKQAVSLGDLQPAIVRRLMGMLYRNPGEQANQIEQLVSVLRSKGFPVEDLTISDALGAIGKGDVTRGLALARQAIPESSTNFSDHLTLARLYTVAGQHAGADKELRRAIELAPGVPETWLS